jgi:Uma2 family endonuclease
MSIELFAIDLPLRVRPERPMSDSEFMQFCAANEPNRFELDANGEILVMSPTGSAGGGAETEATIELGIWARTDGRGKVFGPNAGFKLPDGSVRAADAAWVSWTKWNALTGEQQRGFAPICPEFVIEVRSESDRLPALHQKKGLWVANGAEIAWLIDPFERLVSVYRAGDGPEHLTDPSSIQGTGPIAGFELVLSRIWS